MTVRGLLTVTSLSLVMCLAGAHAEAQLAVAGKSGVVMGHLHLWVRDLEGYQRFWTALGGTPVENGRLQFMQFPGVLVMGRQAEPSGGTAGSAVDHFAFAVKDLQGSLARWRVAGLQVEPTTKTTQVFLVTPDAVRVEILEDKSLDAPIKLDHVHFSAASPADMQAWYVKTFGAVPGTRGPFAVAELPGVTLMFSKADGTVTPTKGSALDHIGFEVRNLEQFVKTIEASGVKIDMPFRQVPNSDLGVAFVTDPSGTSIELNEHLPPAGSPRIPWVIPHTTP